CRAEMRGAHFAWRLGLRPEVDGGPLAGNGNGHVQHRDAHTGDRRATVLHRLAAKPQGARREGAAGVWRSVARRACDAGAGRVGRRQNHRREEGRRLDVHPDAVRGELTSERMAQTSLNGRVALVTGASRGIGKGIALALAAAGCDVAVNYATREADARGVADEIRALGRRAVV